MALSKVQSQAESRAAIEAQEALRRRAARQAARDIQNPADIPSVECAVLPLGDGKIAMGEHVGGIGDAYYDEGETFTVQVPIAVELYARGYVNFEGAKEAVKAAKDARAEAADQRRQARETEDE